MTECSKSRLPITVGKASCRWILAGNARREIFRQLFESESAEGLAKGPSKASGAISAKFVRPSNV